MIKMIQFIEFNSIFIKHRLYIHIDIYTIIIFISKTKLVIFYHFYHQP